MCQRNVEQGARDSIQFAINAFERARDARSIDEMRKALAAGLAEIGNAIAIQDLPRVSPALAHGGLVYVRGFVTGAY